MEMTVTTPRDVDGIQLSVTITGRDFSALGAKAYTAAVEKLGLALAQEILTKAVTRSL